MLHQLLYEDEGTTLDFKRDQYPFVKATEEEKSELLKDILGFANCWRRNEAFILIGVEEVQGGKSTVFGITEHLVDHSLQQFVNSLTNRPLRFAYETCEYEGKQIGVVRIDVQERPIYLKRDYGKLKKGEVYVRRGSSTNASKPAEPDEIASMGKGNFTESKEASLSVEFASIDLEQRLGVDLEWTAEFCEMPDHDDIPLLDDRPQVVRLPGGNSIQVPNAASFDPMSRLNETYFQDLANYEFTQRLFRKTRLVVMNNGSVPAMDVRLEITAPVGEGYCFVDKSEIHGAPERRNHPFSSASIENFKLRPSLRHAGYVYLERNEQQLKVEIDCGNLQPGRNVWTDTFYLGIAESGDYEFKGKIFAANLTNPQDFSLKLHAKIDRTSMTLDELLDLGKDGEVDDE